MIHLGDITKINGGTAPIVDCIIGGSPCQDLSIAGKRAGLAGERSGLYMEQIRTIKEMREHDRANGRSGEFIRPRYMVWENVPGAFSSNHGKDFAAVLEEAVRVVEPEAPPVPVPEKGWPTSGCLMGDGWSVAWRVLDAQFWGVPQRRRRIALVADFGGQSAPEILFVRKGLSGDSAPGGKAGKGLAGGPESGTTFAVRIRGGCDGGGKGALVQTEVSGTFGCNNDQTIFCLNDQGGSVMGISEDVSGTLRALEHGHQPTILDMSHACDVVRDCGGISPSLQARMGTGGNQVPLTYKMRGFGDYCEGDVASSCKQRDFKRSTDLVCAVDCRNGTENPNINGTLQAKESGGSSLNLNNVCRVNMAVRRLTPLECERLQGFPDGWTDIGEWVDSKGKKRQTTDSARYKALGNSIALPPWKWVLKRLCAQYERDATMASLFDGIGGFPLIWEQLNGKGSCLWASEIEEFPMAVTRKRFNRLEIEADRNLVNMNSDKKILDVTCGTKTIWFNKNHPNAIYADKRTEHLTNIWKSGNGESERTCFVNPDVICDFTDLPFDDNQFALVVFDPPHLVNVGEKSWMCKKYGKIDENWPKMLHDGFRECMRVLKPDGVLVFKWSEAQIPANDVWKAIGEKPLFGHHSGKKSQTFWGCFMKLEDA